MGTYINIGNAGFQSIRNGEYIDKSGLIDVVNRSLFTEHRFSCVSRARRFGKSIAAKMLCAYYDQSCDSRHLFQDLEIANHPSFEQHLNQYPVIYLDMSEFLGAYECDNEHIVGYIQRELRRDILAEYPHVVVDDEDRLLQVLLKVSQAIGKQFILIIDEWDAICREPVPGSKAMDQYVMWLRSMFKGVNATRIFAAVYMTGILPIKKYKTESALNNFAEYSMVNPKVLASYFGFTKDEVYLLAERHGMDFEELEKWYDGYQIGPLSSMFNPNSVMQAVVNNWLQSYWASTGAYDAVANYIRMNYEGLKDDVLKMLSGGRVLVDPTTFQNDMSVVRSKDDVLTVLIHLGYLSYDWSKSECYVPNYEVSGELANAVKESGWKNVADALQQSRQLLHDTLAGDSEAVARGVERVHDEHTSILSYNNENSLACVLSIAYYFAKSDYIIHRELPTGKCFADLVLIPRKNVDKPAIVLELKCDQNTDAAIDQIHRREYPVKIQEYTGDILLVGVNYDRQTKTHACKIEKLNVES